MERKRTNNEVAELLGRLAKEKVAARVSIELTKLGMKEGDVVKISHTIKIYEEFMKTPDGLWLLVTPEVPDAA